MARVRSARDLTRVPVRAVVINAGTELATTVAIASLQAHAPNARILVVDSRAVPASSPHLDALATMWDFDLVEFPLAPHGRTLDALVEVLPPDELWFLLDSESELRDRAWFDKAIAAFADPTVFGTGWVRPGHWVLPIDTRPGTCWLPTKYWTGCVLFRAEAIRAARAMGVLLRTEVGFNDIAWSERASRVLALRFDNQIIHRGYIRRALRSLPCRWRESLDRMQLRWLRWARSEVEGERPNLVFHDTGSRVHDWCVVNGWSFVDHGVPPEEDSDVVRSWHPGLTTRLLRAGPDTPLLVEPEHELRAALRERYHIDWDDFGVPAWSWPRIRPPSTPESRASPSL